MISGYVNDDLEPIVPLTVEDVSGNRQLLEARIDSGFDGWLSLSPAILASLGVPVVDREDVLLGDGSVQSVVVHDTPILWDGGPLVVRTDAFDTPPTIGLALLEGYEIRIEVKRGGMVTITKLP
jgi:clan AA aspartic protease